MYEDSTARGVNEDEEDNGMYDAGAAYVFIRSNSTWQQQAYIKACNPGMEDWFGAAIALSSDGSTLAVEAYSEDSAAQGINGDETDNSMDGAGAVYLY
jgi:hypothetical protein